MDVIRRCCGAGRDPGRSPVSITSARIRVYETRSEHNRIEVQPVAAGRGLIFDRRGVLLAENRSVSSLEIVEERTDGEIAETISAVGDLIEIQISEIEAFHKRLRGNGVRIKQYR
ncbi:MAG: hypothetical protein Ct9H300mP8_11710 [Gammaproteobacteria bacterium]|nr:MAG: hypothetical protein Ct9H300mP8_11710 [Gammaproteobacteria bacterium]